MLARNTPLPCEKSQVFYTMHPGETRIVVPVLEGESEDPANCIRIGEVVVDGLPPERAAHQPVTITMAYDRDGILVVTASDEGSERMATTAIERTGRMMTAGPDSAAAAAVEAAVVH